MHAMHAPISYLTYAIADHITSAIADHINRNTVTIAGVSHE